MRMSAHGEVRPTHRRMEIAARRADALTVADDALHVTDTRLLRAVVVAIAWDAHLDGALDEGLAQRIAPFEIGDRQVALAATKRRVGRAGFARQAILAATEVR